MKTLSVDHQRWLLFSLAGVQFTHIVDFMIMMPLGPQLTSLLNISDAQFGLLVSAYTIAGGVSGLVAALFIDRIDHKYLLLILYTCFALATMLCGLAQNYGQLILARIGAGCFGGILSALIQTIVAECIPYERRGRAMGILMSAFSLSTVAGVPLGLVLSDIGGWNTPFFAIAALSLFFILLVYWHVPQGIPIRSFAKSKTGIAGSLKNISQIITDRSQMLAISFSALMILVGFFTIPYITLYLQHNVGVTQGQIPIIYFCGGIASLIGARVIGVFSDKYGKHLTFKCLALICLFPLFGITVLPSSTFIVLLPVTTAFFVCVSGRTIPGMALVTEVARPEIRGTFMTINTTAQSVAMGLASWVGGLIISRNALGQIENYWVTALVGSLVSLITIYLVGRLQVYPQPSAKPSKV